MLNCSYNAWSATASDLEAIMAAMGADNVEVEFRAEMIRRRAMRHGQKSLALEAATLVACCRLGATPQVTHQVARRLHARWDEVSGTSPPAAA